MYYLDDNGEFPSGFKEKLGRWCGLAENIGDTLTYWILTDDTEQLIARSVIRPVTEEHRNKRADRDYLGDESEDVPSDKKEKSPKIDYYSDLNGEKIRSLPKFSPEELLDRTFLYSTEDGQRVRAEILKKSSDENAQSHQSIKLLCKVGDDDAEEILTYTEICQLIEEQDAHDEEKQWTYKKLLAHQGPLKSTDKNYKGSKYSVKVLWEDDTETWEPLTTVIKDDPVTVATYALENQLMNTEGWKRLRRYTKNKKKYKQLVQHTAWKSERRAPIYMFGVQVPRNHKEATQLDEKNGNTKWADAEKKELNRCFEYKTFIEKGVDYKQGKEYTRIRVHFVYAMKHDLRHKARMVAGGHMTAVEKESNYSGVVSLRSMRLALVIGELNGLDVFVGDMGNAYLGALTKELVYFIAGPEFGALEGHVMIIYKALYGLRSSGARFHETMANTLIKMGCKPTLADPDLWYRDAGDHYEYICVYVDDLMCIHKHARAFFDESVKVHGYILKGVDTPSYHLGGTFGRDPDGTLYWGAEAYVKKLMENYKRMFGNYPNMAASPLQPDSSPELDTSDLLNEEGI